MKRAGESLFSEFKRRTNIPETGRILSGQFSVQFQKRVQLLKTSASAGRVGFNRRERERFKDHVLTAFQRNEPRFKISQVRPFANKGFQFG